MSWNYRVVRFNGADGEAYYEIKEVFYNRDGTLMGYADAVVSSGDFDELIKVLAKMKEGSHKLVLNEEDFHGGDTRKKS